MSGQDSRLFFDALESGQLERSRALSMLRVLGTWARALAKASGARLEPALRAPLCAVLAAIEADVAALQDGRGAIEFEVEVRAQASSDELVLATLGEPSALEAAVLAFLDGLGRFRSPRLAEALGVPRPAGSFLGGALEIPPSSRIASPSARAVDEALEDLAGGLAPATYPAEQIDARVLNREAGNHAIARDPCELRAALEAGRETWTAWPYYAIRYGERGRRFTRSDSAWLVALSEEPPSSAQRQVDWLARTLAHRGMPVLLLEEHLGRLYAALSAALPERAEQYAILRDAGRELGRVRRAFLSDDDLEALTVRFEVEAGPELAGRIPRLGALLGAALADRNGGNPGSLTSLRSWLLGEAAPRDPRWARAIERTLAEAEARVPRPIRAAQP